MKKIFTIASLFSFVFLFAQHEVAKKIQELETQRTFFKPFSVLKLVANNDISINKIVENATNATIDKKVVNDIVANKYQNIEINFPYNGKIVTLDLYKVDLFSEDFHVDTDKQKNISYNKGVYYRGIVNGDYTSVACFNFFENELNGMVSNDELSNLIIGKLDKINNTTDYIIYADSNLKIQNGYECSFKDDETIRNKETTNANRDIASTRCVTMYFEIDYNLFQSNSNSTTTTTNWMTSVFNNVQTLYNNDAITVSLKSMFIWTTQDPYEGIGTSSTAYLYKFNEVRPVFDGDVGQLVGIDPGGLGGVAVGINGLCSQDNFSYADVNFSYSTVPTYSWTIEVITHEFGHLLGSPHTHACVWNNNNTAIDNCASSAQGASAEGYSCRTNPLTIPSSTQKGTIMSYCHLVSGVGIKFSNGFGTQPKNRVLAAVNGGPCLSTDCINTCINTVSSIEINTVTSTDAVVTWVDSGTFTAWKVRVYPFGGTAGSWINVTTNNYSVSGLSPNTYYVVEVSPSCSAGLTSNGRQLIFVTAADFCNGIQYTDTGGISGDYTNMETVVRTIIPNVANNNIVLTFTDFALEVDYDYLNIYDGNTTAAPQLSPGLGFTGTTNPGTFTSSAADGSLTVKFYSDQGVVDAGFIANISCTPNLSVNNYNGYLDFSYFPNPTNGKVTINSKTPISQVLVYSVTGQLLYENQTNSLNTNVDISSFAVGTYFFKLKFEGDKEANFKVVRK
ncbi:M12 family metallo-peptidase [Flavobacterium sp. SUN052]|uniref:M12 family metallo-peptidase n=1 Tax=Flavobacterium sp. SUN052 TaxID=3002441 RepID=UPI00237E4C73|nr:M12 family metallo-peptidase [Flavobacterium sp. SUN052]MEC4003370.1 M12 family metallo-peptidase [Flavobacterium sp. SUN052]